MAVQTTQAAGRPAQRQRPLNVLSGVPDNRLCEITVSGKGTLVVNLPGTADIVQFVPRAVFGLNVVQIGPRRPIGVSVLKPGPILNHVADADRCPAALMKAEQLVTQSRRACFNHPSSVLQTTRDQVARTLAGIDGLWVPRTIRHTYIGAAGLAQAIAGAGLSYPVLVRIAGDHGGVSTVQVSDTAGLDEMAKLNCHGSDVYATEFVDFKSADGRYRKFRVAIIGEEIFLRHMIVGDQWMLHAERRGKNTTSEEAKMLQAFDKELVLKLRPLFLEIAKRLDLDYVGVDCNIAVDGTVLLFEANACMNIMANTQPSPNMWDGPIARIKGALMRLLAEPRRWRHPPAQR